MWLLQTVVRHQHAIGWENRGAAPWIIPRFGAFFQPVLSLKPSSVPGVEVSFREALRQSNRHLAEGCQSPKDEIKSFGLCLKELKAGLVLPTIKS